MEEFLVILFLAKQIFKYIGGVYMWCSNLLVNVIFKKYLSTNHFLLILLFLQLTMNMAFAKECIYVKPEISIVKPTVLEQDNIAECTYKEVEEIEKAENILNKFWRSLRKNKYDFFSESYKKRLKKLHHIKNSDDYIKETTTHELHWLKQTYQRFHFKKDQIETVVLANWELEGYEGIMSFTFTLIKEKGSWKISEVKF